MQDHVDETDYLYTITEICNSIPCHPRTWHKWCRQAGVQSRGRGKTKLYTQGDVFMAVRFIYGTDRAMDILANLA